MSARLTAGATRARGRRGSRRRAPRGTSAPRRCESDGPAEGCPTGRSEIGKDPLAERDERRDPAAEQEDETDRRDDVVVGLGDDEGAAPGERRGPAGPTRARLTSRGPGDASPASPISRPCIGSPRPWETFARISGSLKCVVASTIARARGAGSCGLVDPRSDEHAVDAQLHHQRSVGRRREPARREVHDRQSALLRHDPHQVDRRPELLRLRHVLLGSELGHLGDLAAASSADAAPPRPRCRSRPPLSCGSSRRPRRCDGALRRGPGPRRRTAR